MNKLHLTEKEEELMRHFWEHGPMFVRELIDLLPEPKPHFNTVSTFVRLMEQKGFLGHETLGNSYRYFPLVSRREYSREVLRGVVGRYFNNSLHGVISALVGEENLTDAQIDELVNMVKNKKS